MKQAMIQKTMLLLKRLMEAGTYDKSLVGR